MNDMDIILQKRSKYRYTQRIIPVIFGEDTIKWYNCILLENKETLETYVSEFSDFFVSKNIINLSIKTKMNNYCTTIIMFLNYIFFEMDEPINSISDIDLEIGESFLASYSEGYIGRATLKTDESIVRVANSLTYFYYWLYTCRDKRTKKKKYKLKHLSQDMFTYTTFKQRLNTAKSGKDFIEKKKLDCIFTYSLYGVVTSKKLDNPTEYLIYSLLDIAEQYDPMLAFPIAIGAFAGLRQGEICQICKGNIYRSAFLGYSSAFYIDLQKVRMLRSDGVLTGSIKRKRVQLVYSSFLPYIDKLYKQHISYLKQEGYYNNKYGALIIDTNGKAMTTSAFRKRFIKLTQKLTERLYKLHDDLNAVMTLDLLTRYRITPHCLRYFFTQYLKNSGEDAHGLASFRGDLNLNSALTYLQNCPKNAEQIRILQDSFMESYCKYTMTTIEEFKKACGIEEDKENYV